MSLLLSVPWLSFGILLYKPPREPKNGGLINKLCTSHAHADHLVQQIPQQHLGDPWPAEEGAAPQTSSASCARTRAGYAGSRYADHFEQEPDGLDATSYVNYCLEVARRHGVTLFLPGGNLSPIVRAQQRFADLGTQVIAAANAATLGLLSNKANVYVALQGEDFRLPDYEVVNDLAGFDAAWARLRPRHGSLCYKPAVSVYGIGFHLVADAGPALTRLRAKDRVCRSLDEARRSLEKKGRFRDLVVMQYLPGPERSVDCLARDGELLRCVGAPQTARRLRSSRTIPRSSTSCAD